MNQRFREIEELLQTYFDGLYHCDLDRLKTVFHRDAVYATTDEGTPLIRDMETYFSVVAKRVSPASRKEARRDIVEAIDIAGENTALARVRCRIGPRDFVDFLSLIRIDGQWQIIAKVFQITQRQS